MGWLGGREGEEGGPPEDSEWVGNTGSVGGGGLGMGAGFLNHCPATTQLLLLQYPHVLGDDRVVVVGPLGGEQQEGAGVPCQPPGGYSGVDLGRGEHNGLESRGRAGCSARVGPTGGGTIAGAQVVGCLGLPGC